MILDHQKRFAENEEKREQLKRQWNNRHIQSNSTLGGGVAGANRRMNQLNQ